MAQGRRNKGRQAPAKNTTPSRQDRSIQQPPFDTDLSQIREVMISSSPMPPPQMLRDYDEVVPGTAQRLLDAFISQEHHRQEMEKMALKSEITRGFLGLWLGFVVVLSAISAFVWISLALHQILASIGIFASIATLAGVFVYGSYSQKRERIEKARVLAEDDDDRHD
jgi:uncharacterized membrane protein